MSRPAPEALRVAETARTIALQMMSERGRGAVLVGGARVDAALEALLKAALAPPSGPETLFLTDRPLGSFGARIALAECYRQARGNPLWDPLERILDDQLRSNTGSADSMALDPALRDYILLITILVAFLEATAQQLSPLQPPVSMGFVGVSRSNAPAS